uniref:Uncharacterized protein n=1 Tax=Rhizophora mucronata TaxID=61149 RepID=A0A2P2NU84_RHIMU
MVRLRHSIGKFVFLEKPQVGVHNINLLIVALRIHVRLGIQSPFTVSHVF